VEVQSLRNGSHFPQAEHGLSSSTDPVKRDATLRDDVGELQPQHVAEE
jgi:hypothetical protein